MSDLDKAIRAAAYTVDRDKLHAALAVVLDRHVHTGDDDVYIGPKVFWRCSQCGGLGGRWCDEVLAIANALGVSGEDRSEPTPAPRPGDRVRLFTPDDIITGVLYVGQDGKQRVLEHDRWGHLVDVPGRRVEVVSPEGTS